MVTQITLKPEGPPGLPSDARQRRLIRFAPLEVASGEVLFHFSRLQRSHTSRSRIVVPDARTQPANIEVAAFRFSGQGLRIKPR